MGKPKGSYSPPRVPRDGRFTECDRLQLRAHLTARLAPAAAEHLIEDLERWLMFWVPWPDGRNEVLDLENEARDGAGRVAELVRSLEAEVAAAPDLEGRLDFPAPRLERLRLCAEAVAVGPRRHGGRPRLEWRDELVAIVAAHYTGKRGHHFEKTIAMLLGFLGVKVGRDLDGLDSLASLHREIGRILQREPMLPFVCFGP